MSASGKVGETQLAGGYNAPTGSPFTLGTGGTTGTIDTSSLGRWVSVHPTANASGNTLTWEASSDGVAWAPFRLQAVDNAVGAGPSLNTNLAGFIYSGQVPAQFIRVRVSNFVGGTTTFAVVFHPTPAVVHEMLVDTELPLAAALADGVANPSVPTVGAALLAFNGATYDRLGTAVAIADGGTLTRAQAVLGYGYNGNGLDRLRTANVVKTATATAAGSTALWTPAAGKKFRIMRLLVQVSDEATQAAGGVDTITLLDSATSTQLVFSPYVPAAAFANAGVLYSSGWIDLGNGILSAVANNVLNISLANALTAGVCRVLAIGTEE